MTDNLTFAERLSKLKGEFLDALNSLPKSDLNSEISLNAVDGTVTLSLEAFLALSGHFKGQITYGIQQTHGGEGGDDTTVYILPGMEFSDARDLAEISGHQLMQKFESKWIEA